MDAAGPSRIHFPQSPRTPEHKSAHPKPKYIPDDDSHDPRRRALSAEPESPLRTSHRRHANGLGQSKSLSSSPNGSLAVRNAHGALPVFSDEYDLAHEDPRIIQEVQRALKKKARRESRIKSGNLAPSPLRNEDASLGSSSRSASPANQKQSSEQFLPFPRHSTELDFGPSVGPSNPPGRLHPVPILLDDGKTLDWSGSDSGDERYERKWSISMSKRKGKEKEALPIDLLSSQEQNYLSRLDRIRTLATPTTQAKVRIVSDQLGHRYNALFRPPPLMAGWNLLHFVRWYQEQPHSYRYTMELSQPFAWLKHLDKRRAKSIPRSPMYANAWLTEEYLSVRSRELSDEPSTMETIPEHHDAAKSDDTPSVPSAGRFAPFSPASRRSSSISVGSPLPNSSLGEGRISFEPLVPSRRNSIESRESLDSLPSATSSRRKPFVTTNGAPSPSSSRMITRDFALNNVRSVSDDELSSLKGSVSGVSENGKRYSAPPPKRPVEMDLRSSDTESDIRVVISSPPAEHGGSSLGKESKPPDSAALADADTATAVGTSPNAQRLFNNRILVRRRTRRSLPSSSQPALDESERKKREEADEEDMRQQYEQKAILLQQITTQNQRIRQLLYRVSTGVKDYEQTFSSGMKKLGLPHHPLPPSIVDAFSHDPAAVTGATRRYQGWRAVDDIEDRLFRQRKEFQNFIIRAVETDTTLTNSVLQDPLDSLLNSLIELERQRDEIHAKAADVSEVLEEVKSIQGETKMAYNEATTQTSTVYPELSQMAALFENYNDHYQRAWDSLSHWFSVILDTTVTPVWRTYGTTIFEDASTFLIVPWYRNEFTGEAKRYTINAFPRRSFRHWVGLLFFFVLSNFVLLLNCRTIIFSIGRYSLKNIEHTGMRYLLIPFFWTLILVQVVALLVEAAIVILQLGVVSWWIGWAFRIFT